MSRSRAFLFVLVASLFVIFYPIMISMYIYLPLLIGIAGYLIVWGIEGRGAWYIWFPLIYTISLEASLSLPIFLSLLTIFLFYLTLYKKILYFKRCPVCVGILSVISIDLYYLFIVLFYDFIFNTTSIVIDLSLLYTMLFDLLIVALI